MQIQDYVPRPLVPRPDASRDPAWSGLTDDPFLLVAVMVGVLLLAVLVGLLLRNGRERPPTPLSP